MTQRCRPPDDVEALDASPVRTLDKTAEERMIARIDEIKSTADTVGGVIEVLAYGVPAGIGTYVESDRRLDAALASAVMGIQAIKGVEIGDGFLEAVRPGSQAHDEMVPGADGRITRLTNRGGRHRRRHVERPADSRTGRDEADPLDSARPSHGRRHRRRVRIRHQPAFRHHGRACGLRRGRGHGPTHLARYALDKFGGDSVAETRRNFEQYVASWPEHMR